MKGINPPTPAFNWPTVDVNPSVVVTQTELLKGVKYKLGAKAPSLSATPDAIHAIDCSGFTRYVLYRATNFTLVMPDGSWGQMDWAEKQGFKDSTVGAGKLKDGILRLAVLPQQPGKGVGRHVVFILNGRTYESAGGRGPCSRVWNGLGYQAKCKVWVLAHKV